MKKPAFTLIELTITIAILGLTLTITGGVLLSVVKSFQKQNELQRIERNGDIALRTIEEKVRKAKSIEALPAGPITGIRIFGDGSSEEIIGLYMNPNTCPSPSTNGTIFIAPATAFDASGFVVDDIYKITDDSEQGGVSITTMNLQLVDGKPIQLSATINVESSSCKSVQEKITKTFQTFVTARGSY